MAEQMTLFAGAMVLGGVIGVLYDLSDCLCRRKRGVGRALLDAAFCLTAAGLILLFLLIYTQGVLRGYLFIGGLLGFGAEHTCLSPLLRRVLLWLFLRLRTALRHLRNGFFWLFSFPRGQ